MLLELTDGWTLHAVRGPVPGHLAQVPIPAQVPGCVHVDLLSAGHIGDPYLDETEAELNWIGRVEWRYSTVFEWDGDDADECVDLVALGLDTAATVRINDTVVARTANMHRSYRVPVRDVLRPGRNELAIVFAAPIEAAEQASQVLGPRPHVNKYPFNATRKMAANFGWDWGPELVTAGIWRPISIQSWRVARIAAVRPLVTVDRTTGRLQVHVDVERAAGAHAGLRVDVTVDGRHATADLAPEARTATLTLDIPDVALWWPHGFGDQPLYPVEVTLSAAGTRLDGRHTRVGFRTVSLDTTPDEHGTPFTLRVNGEAVFARGVNWIPEDCFPSRIDRARYAERLNQARDANVNLVRVWGGGIYESEDFYDVCDELGLLVWQDFPFACAAYAEEQPLRGEVIAEAREAITRLCPHPSLAIWNGGNETIWGHADWGWEQPLAGRSWGWGYYTEVLPTILAELDPTRPYTPGCPYSISTLRHPNDPAHGTTHLWDVWNELDYTAYRDYLPRFVSEFGFQGPPTWATLTRAIHDDPMAPDSPGILAHQKADDGQDKLARGLKAHLPVPETFDDWHWATSLNQARAVAFGIDHFRSHQPMCMGAIVWQLNDCWPVTSWSAIDGDGRRKPLWYALRRSFRDRLLTVQPRDGGLAVVAVNDSMTTWSASLRITRRTFDGRIEASFDVPLDLDPRGSTTIALPSELAVAADPAKELLLVDGGGERAWWFFTDDIDSTLPRAEFDCAVDATDGGYRLVVTARTMLRDLAVLADRVAADAVADDMLITVLPGESATFHVRTRESVHPRAFTDPCVLRCANQLVHRDAVTGTIA